MDEIISTVNAEPAANVEPQNVEQVEATNEPVNAGSGEVTTPTVEGKPVQSAEDNARYAQIRREAESKARDKTIADMNMAWNGQPITTYDQYVKAKAESEQYQKEQAIREEYEAKGLPEELVEELVESKRDREERNAEKLKKEAQDKKNAEYNEFFELFKEENGRDYDTASDTLPDEVWLMNAEDNPKRKSLVDAYAHHLNKQLKAKIAEYDSKFQAIETNKANSASSPGSVTGNGNSGTDFISFDSYESNKHDQSWVNKNFSKIMESRAKW